MTTIQRKRLEKLADYMRSVPRAAFDMQALFDCGTKACAAGYAMRLFPRSLKPSLNGLRYRDAVLASEALPLFFGLTENEANELFNLRMVQGSDETPKQWSRRCREFLASYDKQQQLRSDIVRRWETFEKTDEDL